MPLASSPGLLRGRPRRREVRRLHRERLGQLRWFDDLHRHFEPPERRGRSRDRSICRVVGRARTAASPISAPNAELHAAAVQYSRRRYAGHRRPRYPTVHAQR